MEKNTIEYLESMEPTGNNKKQYWNLVPQKHLEMPVGDWLEFGVYTGLSARIFLRNMPRDNKLFLFDSFEGLPEEWTPDYPVGHFACDVPRFKDSRVEIVKGWFEDTLPEWVEAYGKPAALIHIDCDIYSSTKTVLKYVDSLIGPETLVMLDDYYGTENHIPHVYKAFQEYIKENGYDFEYLFRTPKKSQVTIRIKK